MFGRNQHNSVKQIILQLKNKQKIFLKKSKLSFLPDSAMSS